MTAEMVTCQRYRRQILHLLTFKEPVKSVLTLIKCHHKILNASYIQEFLKYISDFN